ncbi:MAG: hypothetical protein JXA69_05055 [Phycisphaerae bacterium]|nr:hypothetical protein [Phycisphaerae bacterium]
MRLHSLFVISLAGFIALSTAAHAVADDEWSKTPEQRRAQWLEFKKANSHVPTPKKVWPEVIKDLVPADLKILSDEIIPSDTDPTKKLRRIKLHFKSLKFEGKAWEHPSVIFMPADNSINMTPERKGKVVIVASPGWLAMDSHIAMFGEPIATRTGYPTMVVTFAGIHTLKNRIEGVDIDCLTRQRLKTGKNYYNMNCQLAVSYTRAMDVFQKVLGLARVSAVIGGHSKCGRSATVAAAFDDRVASPIIMGNEGVFSLDKPQWHLSFHHAFFQDEVKVPVFYIGATDEGGYKRFNVNLLQERLKRPMTVEMIPNYRHHNYHDKQFTDFMMWVTHIFDGRPISKITDVSYERKNHRNYYRARIEGDAKVKMVLVWYVYTDNPQWTGNVWYDWLMLKQKNGYYETSVPGAKPDAYMIEVTDMAQGFKGYVTSLPQRISDAPILQPNCDTPAWMGYPHRDPEAD